METPYRSQADQYLKGFAKLRKGAAEEFRKEFTIGNPTDADEAGLKRLVKQLKSGWLKVKLFLKHTTVRSAQTTSGNARESGSA